MDAGQPINGLGLHALERATAQATATIGFAPRRPPWTVVRAVAQSRACSAASRSPAAVCALETRRCKWPGVTGG